jgi:hypothetical protein
MTDAALRRYERRGPLDIGTGLSSCGTTLWVARFEVRIPGGPP